MSVPTPMRARHLLAFLMLAGVSVRSLSCGAPLDLQLIEGQASVPRVAIGADSDVWTSAVLPDVARSVSAVIEPQPAFAATVGTARSNRTIPLGLRN